MTLEKGIETYFNEQVKKIGGIPVKGPAQYNAGIPDREVLLPGGITLWVELKAPGKEPRPVQIAWHKKLRKLGFEVFVIDNRIDVRKFIEYAKEKISAS